MVPDGCQMALPARRQPSSLRIRSACAQRPDIHSKQYNNASGALTPVQRPPVKLQQPCCRAKRWFLFRRRRSASDCAGGRVCCNVSRHQQRRQQCPKGSGALQTAAGAIQWPQCSAPALSRGRQTGHFKYKKGALHTLPRGGGSHT
jgi:hypothetical protein